MGQIAQHLLIFSFMQAETIMCLTCIIYNLLTPPEYVYSAKIHDTVMSIVRKHNRI